MKREREASITPLLHKAITYSMTLYNTRRPLLTVHSTAIRTYIASVMSNKNNAELQRKSHRKMQKKHDQIRKGEYSLTKIYTYKT